MRQILCNFQTFRGISSQTMLELKFFAFFCFLSEVKSLTFYLIFLCFYQRESATVFFFFFFSITPLTYFLQECIKLRLLVMHVVTSEVVSVRPFCNHANQGQNSKIFLAGAIM